MLAPESPVLGGLSAAAGSGASQAVKEAGGSPLAQTLTGLAAGSAPGLLGAATAAGARGIVRGGEEGRTAMQSALDTSAESGTKLSAGQAGGSAPVQYLEGALKALPGSGPLKALPGEQAESLGSNVQDIVDRLSGGTTPSPTEAGAAINAGADTAKQNMRNAETAAFNKLHGLVPRDTPVDVSGTLAKLDQLAKPAEGAEASTGALVSPKIASLRDNLTADMASNAAKAAPPPNVNHTPAPQPDAMAEAVTAEKQASGLPYNAVRQLRTALGNSIDWGYSPADPVTNGALKQVYGTLTEDMTNGAKSVGPEAAQAASDANSLYTANSAKREFLNGIIDKAGGPETVYQSAINGTKLGATKIGGVMSALGDDQQNVVRATILDKMGRASGAQDSPFNASTFLTNWTKLDPAAKDALFGATGNQGTLRSSLDSLTSTMNTIKKGSKLQNWSGTGEKIGHAGGVVAAFEGLKALAAGNPHVLLGTAAGVAANNLLSRALTNPRVVNWFAQTTKAPMSVVPNAVNQLSKMNDPDAQALASYLQQPQPIARAAGGKVEKPDLEKLVMRLIQRWKAAKKETDKSTKPLLHVPDAAIAKALEVAARAI